MLVVGAGFALAIACHYARFRAFIDYPLNLHNFLQNLSLFSAFCLYCLCSSAPFLQLFKEVALNYNLLPWSRDGLKPAFFHYLGQRSLQRVPCLISWSLCSIIYQLGIFSYFYLCCTYYLPSAFPTT